MRPLLRQAFNCFLAAGLGLVAWWLYGWFGDRVIAHEWSRELLMEIAGTYRSAFVYDVVRMAAASLPCAFALLQLTPQKPLLIAACSLLLGAAFAGFTTNLQSPYHATLAAVLVLELPIIYLVLRQILSGPHNKSLNTDACSARAG